MKARSLGKRPSVKTIMTKRLLTPEEYMFVISACNEVSDKDFHYLEHKDMYRNFRFHEFIDHYKIV